MCFRDKPLSVSALQKKQNTDLVLWTTFKAPHCWHTIIVVKYQRFFQFVGKNLTTHPMTAGIRNMQVRGFTQDSLSFGSRMKTYFPPQKIFVVITRLERLKMEKHICKNTCQTDPLNKVRMVKAAAHSRHGVYILINSVYKQQ